MTNFIDRIPIIALPSIFIALGMTYCAYSVAFRWPVIRSKYGTMSLYWWLVAVWYAFSIAGTLVAVVIWLIQQQLLGWDTTL